jgi:MoaA/NifB/PqqE/SkfB family radical SAM enzyme
MHTAQLETLYAPLKVVLEFTTDCNMRCVYCAVSDAGYRGFHMTDEVFEKCVALMDNYKPQLININGHGEATYVPNWRERAETLLARGYPLRTITNSAFPLSWEEASTLAQFQHIAFSIDTVDKELLKKLRRKVDIRTFSYNVNLIKSAALHMDRKLPEFRLNVVVSDLTIKNLKLLLPFAAAHNCNVYLQPLTELHIDADPKPRSIFTLQGDELEDARAEYREALVVAQQLKERVGFKMETFALLHNSLVGNEPPALEQHLTTVYEGQIAGYAKMAPPLKGGETKYCTDPWINLYIAANGDVRFCCESQHAVANVKDINSFHEALLGNKSLAFKNALLTGQALHRDCLSCTIRMSTPVQKLQTQVVRMFGLQVNPESRAAS